MEIAVTGAYGHVGANLVRSLLADGHTVRAIDIRRTAALDGLSVRHVHASVTDRAAMVEALRGTEVLFHLAAKISVVGDPDGAVWRTNVDGSAATGRAALDAGVSRMVHVSSVHALDYAAAPHIVDDETPLARSIRTPVYDRSKATSEAFMGELAERGLDVVIVRPTGIIGPGDHDVSRMGRFIRNVGAGRQRISVSGAFDWVDVRDVVDGMRSAAQQGERGRQYLLGGTFTTITDLGSLIAETVGVRGPILTIPNSVVGLVGRPATWLARRTSDETAPTTEALRAIRHGKPVDFRRAQDELGYAPRPLAETIRDTFVWLDEIAPSTSR